MSFQKTKAPLTVAKGRVKCFKCRNVTMAKDGVWTKLELDMVFICRACGTAARTPMPSAPKSPATG